MNYETPNVRIIWAQEKDVVYTSPTIDGTLDIGSDTDTGWGGFF